ncbi:hypothetical protein PDO_0775 [Rhizobium sp. PDO1-076]|uniref:hypothetical protein n=1 Tax=Rhizobium sp. PDO1-076 TaxID=1125979 RepID=UPI00024E2483|nr:hypothetical protein [Rhizobium sp. PDO1-076]EHS48670.1 hypothetical protein PDO_0775 [Rhizobium sp. PDO1-076]
MSGTKAVKCVLSDYRGGNQSDGCRNRKQEVTMGRSILLWLVGVPIPIIILIMLFWR